MEAEPMDIENGPIPIITEPDSDSPPVALSNKCFTGKLTAQFSEEKEIFWTPKVPTIPLFNPAKNPPQLIHSPMFKIGEVFMSHSRWRMLLSTDYLLKGYQRTVAIYLWRHKTPHFLDPDDVFVNYRIHILNIWGTPVFTRESGIRQFTKDACYGFRDFALYGQVEPYISGGKLSVKLEIKLFINRPFLSIQDMNSKIQIQIRDEVIGQARKGVLMAKSQLLCDLILMDPENTIITFPHGAADEFGVFVFKNMIHFLHKGTCPFIQRPNFSQLPKLWELGNQLKVEELKVACFDALVNSDCLSVAFIPYLMELCVKYNLKFKEQYTKSYNKMRSFFHENMEKIVENAIFQKTIQDTKVAEGFADLIMEDPCEEPSEPCEVIIY